MCVLLKQLHALHFTAGRVKDVSKHVSRPMSKGVAKSAVGDADACMGCITSHFISQQSVIEPFYHASFPSAIVQNMPKIDQTGQPLQNTALHAVCTFLHCKALLPQCPHCCLQVSSGDTLQNAVVLRCASDFALVHAALQLHWYDSFHTSCTHLVLCCGAGAASLDVYEACHHMCAWHCPMLPYV